MNGDPNPFQAPRDADDSPTPEIDGVRPLAPPAVVFGCLLGIAMFGDLLGAIVLAEEITTGITFDSSIGRGIFALFSTSFTLVCAIPWWVWAVRAANNVSALGVPLRYSPESLVWWWFVPILNCIRPYQRVCEIWRGSSTAAGGELQPRVPRMFAWWWALWLVRGGLGLLGWLFMYDSEPVVLIIGVVRYGASIAAAVLCLSVVLTVNDDVSAAIHRYSRLPR